MKMQIEVEHCVNCQEQSWCYRHVGDNYCQLFLQLSKAVGEQFPGASICANPIPTGCVVSAPKTAHAQNPHFNYIAPGPRVRGRATRKEAYARIYPRIGAFEVTVNGILIASKLATGDFPALETLLLKLQQISAALANQSPLEPFALPLFSPQKTLAHQLLNYSGPLSNSVRATLLKKSCEKTPARQLVETTYLKTGLNFFHGLSDAIEIKTLRFNHRLRLESQSHTARKWALEAKNHRHLHPDHQLNSDTPLNPHSQLNTDSHPNDKIAQQYSYLKQMNADKPTRQQVRQALGRVRWEIKSKRSRSQCGGSQILKMTKGSLSSEKELTSSGRFSRKMRFASLSSTREGFEHFNHLDQLMKLNLQRYYTHTSKLSRQTTKLRTRRNSRLSFSPPLNNHSSLQENPSEKVDS